ncbi:MAG: hypothetical protein KAT58_02655 [candidate division Zixibacteria bacterium]|nr:hypothetical protein [candidate division Zixibacteria bacterium]
MYCRNLLILLFGLLLQPGHQALGQTPPVRILAYDIKFGLDMPNGQILVLAELKVEKVKTAQKLDMSLTSRAQIASVRARAAEQWFTMSHQSSLQDAVSLIVPPELKSSAKLTLELKYAIPVGEMKGNVMILDRGHRWYPLIVDQIAPFKLTAQVPPGFQVLAVGDLVVQEITDDYSEFVWQSRIPVFKVSLVIARPGLFKETVKECSGKKVYFYSPEDSLDTNTKLVTGACDMLRFYHRLLGDYPHERLTIVDIAGLQGANIATGLIMLGSAGVEQSAGGDGGPLALAIAAQWIGAGVFPRYQSKGFWFLQISLPYYLRLMNLRETQGEEAFAKDLNRSLDAYRQIAGSNKDVPILDIDAIDSNEKGRAIYGKGPYIIDRLVQQIGSDNWEKLLKAIYRNFKGRIFTYDDFIRYLSKYDPDGSAVKTLNKMVTETGLPEE